MDGLLLLLAETTLEEEIGRISSHCVCVCVCLFLFLSLCGLRLCGFFPLESVAAINMEEVIMNDDYVVGGSPGQENSTII